MMNRAILISSHGLLRLAFLLDHDWAIGLRIIGIVVCIKILKKEAVSLGHEYV